MKKKKRMQSADVAFSLATSRTNMAEHEAPSTHGAAPHQQGSTMIRVDMRISMLAHHAVSFGEEGVL